MNRCGPDVDILQPVDQERVRNFLKALEFVCKVYGFGLEAADEHIGVLAKNWENKDWPYVAFVSHVSWQSGELEMATWPANWKHR